MLHYEPPIDDYQFLLHDVIRVADHKQLRGYAVLDEAFVAALLEPLGRFAREKILPLQQVADSVGCRREPDGSVKTPAGYKALYDAYVKDGWPALGAPAACGGQDIPSVVTTAQMEFLNATGQAFAMYLGWGDSASKILSHHGTEQQKSVYLARLVSGEWAGTMAMTEPHCGTDLGQIRTRAVERADRSYAISGTKIFNSGGDHDLTTNIVHFVLARIEGAPAGTRGLSLFLLPKFLPDENGAPSQRNNVTCVGVEHKMGLRGSATCTINYDKAIAWLIGKPGQGLPAMFALMNHIRRTIGPISVGVSDIAYQNAAAYVRERRAGRSLSGPPSESAADPLIEQPDVRRVLLTVAGTLSPARALCLYAALQADIVERSDDAEARSRAEALLGLLTPVTKAFLSDLAFSNTVLAQQLFGGHGYVAETGIEQLVRDVRVLAIAEGANGVQGNDLVQRKIILDSGRTLAALLGEIGRELDEVRGDAAAWVDAMRAAISDLEQATAQMLDKGRADKAFAAAGATDYLTLLGLVLLGYFWVRILAASDPAATSLHAARLSRARFFMEHMLPETALRLRRISAGQDGVMQLQAAAF